MKKQDNARGALLGAVASLAGREGFKALGRKVTKDQILGSLIKSGQSGAVGAALDGILGASEAIKLYRLGYITREEALKHTGNETACGLTTAAAGTLGSTLAALFIGSGSTALVAGMGASVAVRYLYRQQFESVLPDLDEEPDLDEQEREDLANLFQRAARFEGLIPKKTLKKYKSKVDEDSETL